MNSPIATYRIQFHKDFNLDDLEKQLAYLRKLGIGAVYASPILESTPGSTHGYDGTDPENIDPEIGTEQQLRQITKGLRELNISWLQDIVPNHLAFSTANPWMFDVLEKGPRSEYAAFFDMTGTSPLFEGKLMVPFLGAELEEVISEGQIELAFNGQRLVWKYGEEAYPLNLDSYLFVLEGIEDPAHQAFDQLITQLRQLHEAEDPMFFSGGWKEFLLQFAALMKTTQTEKLITNRIAFINKNKPFLNELLGRQEYQLTYWRDTEARINFRRFFTVNGLICLNMQDQKVFDKYHQLVSSLVRDGVFQGLRIDHIDGLFDPEVYLTQLRGLAGEETYIVVEKILEKNEQMPAYWPIQGTTGYEFLADVNNVLTQGSAEQAFTDFYAEFTGDDKPVKPQLHEKKSEILFKHMGGELENLYQLFVRAGLATEEEIAKTGKENIRQAIGEVLIHCPVYRFYGNSMPLAGPEATEVRAIFDKVKNAHPALAQAAELIENAILGDEEHTVKALEFYQRLMQFSGPLMAKGGEDTLMYTYNRFVGHNDVGDFPDRFGLSPRAFHSRMQTRQKTQPLSLNTTSTHDTKRGEDVRARLNVLTSIPDEWFEKVREWAELNKELKAEGPDANDEYLIYQMLIGAYPMPGQDEDQISERIEEYLQKALREAKVKSDWASPNESYEEAARNFASQLLEKGSPFFESFSAFHQKIADHGIINSLAQLVLKFTCPGIPDVYQGCELWDFSLVDPDNRRPVDFEKREKSLDEFENHSREELPAVLWETRYDGKIKLWLTRALYELRKNASLVFTKGAYIPLTVRGKYKEHILAFARKQKKDFYIVAIPLHTAGLCKEQGKDFAGLDWKDTNIVLPDNLSPEWQDFVTGENLELTGKLVPSEIFKTLPISILQGTRVDNERKAGVLLHITSLASPFGVGDLGPEAHAFADFLAGSNQKLWQILPLNPIEAAQANSPYSALSSRAGNPLLISPEVLAEEGLLSNDALQKWYLPESAVVDFGNAKKNKADLLREAFGQFQEKADEKEHAAFEAFGKANSEWLEDFAIYMVLKEKFDDQPWYEWPAEFLQRDPEALEKVRSEAASAIRFAEWQQYIFDKQWKSLKAHCNKQDIKLLGDIPFYVSYDSADVWSHRDLFMVDKDGKITGVAGVPPDAFSDDGQLWGMPVFNWETLKEKGYQWWIRRLAKNMELFDLVRLDHFRAFADYWEVPGGEKTAVNGEWKLGPGIDFFEIAEAELGSLPFIAEDLGEASPAVFLLRDKLALPGMKVLQFAFDENMAQSDHIPHNYSPNFIAYTGTHDNNTTKGWLRQAADASTAEQISKYAGLPVNEENVNQIFCRMVYASVAKAAIIPMQDILDLDESAIMNIPGSKENNWSWRLLPGQVSREAGDKLTEWTVLFNRD